MPLVRLQVRNEYGLGQPELYKETNREDPKAVLDGVAVAGLVGILRQLGDLADFAAEVFHGLQEQVLTTASRSHKLMLRAQNIEASLPPLEKAILTQTSHIHFAYTAGCEWHCRTKIAQNHFIYNDLPQFIMDSYEECRDPPRLHLLDKFDSGGPGSCLRRYSDPTFFKRASAYSDEANSEKIERARKTCRSKKKRLSQRKGGILLGEQMHSNSGRMQFVSHVNGKTSSLQTASPEDMMPKSDPEDHSDSFDSKTGAGYIECVFHSSNYVQLDEQEYKESSSRLTQKTDTLQSASPALDDNFSHDSFDKQIASTSTGLTWDKKEEMMDSKMQRCDGDKTPDVLAENQNLHMHEDEAVIPENSHHNDFLNGVESNLKPVSSRVQTDEIDSEPDRYLDALNDIESESENDLDCEIKQVEQFTPHITGEIMENGVDGATSTALDHDLHDVVYEILSGVSINEERERDFLDSLREIPPLISESHVSTFMSPAPSDVPVNIERTKSIFDSHASESPIYEQVPHRCDSCVLDCSVGTNPLDGAHTLNNIVSGSTETDISSGSRSSDLPDKEADRDFPESLQEIPPLISELCGPSLRSSVPSDVPVNIGRTKNLADSHASESPIMEQVPHISGNSVLDCSVGTSPLGGAHTLKDTESVSIETDISSGSRNSDLPEKEADRDFPESLLEIPPLISEPHGTSLRSPVSSDVPVKIERTKNLADSHTSESPITKQLPHISGNSVLDCSVGTNPLGGAHTLNDTASVSIETDISTGSRSSDLPDKEADRHFPESLLEIPPLISEPHGTNLRSPVSSDVPVKIERTKNLADSHTSESPITEQLPHISENSVLDCSVGTNPLGGAHILNNTVSVSIETDISSGSRSSDLPDKEADRININICKFEETPSESAIDHSISLWTNGGLLGLEPSKPPDFIMSSSLNQGSVTSINVTGGPSNHNSMLKSNGYEEEQNLSAEVAELKQKEPSSRCLTSHSDEQACISVKTSDCHHLRNGFVQKDEEDLDKIRILAPGNALPAADNTRAACTEPSQGSRENSLLAFRLSHRSLINSFCRKVSFDEKSGPDNSSKTGILELSGQNSIVHQSLPETPFKEQVSYGYTLDTPPPSPPLEHMKISFHPIIKVKTSKLKLKFPDGSSYHESTRDVFPSFQLVPELFIPLHDSGSNSDDDDTFCRSSPYVSDDCLSPHSDYNSDQWESGDTSDSSYPGVYDSSHRISLTESKFSSQEIRGVTNVDINLDSGHSMYTQDSVEPSLYGPLLDFPSFDTVNSVLEKEYNKHSDYKNNLKLQSHAEPTPPPLPPKQWRDSNQQLDMMNEMQNYISEDSEQINDPNILESTLQLRPSQVEQNKTDHEFYDDVSCKLKDKLNQQNLNGQKKENQVGTGKDMDEREDFLQQIRTKSFNLRHAVTGKPSASTGPATNGKVTAILEKVNAIRQVVTSDDGEDDNWSDT